MIPPYLLAQTARVTVAGAAAIDPDPKGWQLTLPLALNQFFLTFLWVSGVAAVFALMWSGFQYITAGGDTEKAANSRRAIIYSIIGILLISSSLMLFYATKRVAEHPFNVANEL